MGSEECPQTSHLPVNTGLSLRLQGYYWNTLKCFLKSQFFLIPSRKKVEFAHVHHGGVLRLPLPLLPAGHACLCALEISGGWRPIFP